MWCSCCALRRLTLWCKHGSDVQDINEGDDTAVKCYWLGLQPLEAVTNVKLLILLHDSVQGIVVSLWQIQFHNSVNIMHYRSCLFVEGLSFPTGLCFPPFAVSVLCMHAGCSSKFCKPKSSVSFAYTKGSWTAKSSSQNALEVKTFSGERALPPPQTLQWGGEGKPASHTTHPGRLDTALN